MKQIKAYLFLAAIVVSFAVCGQHSISGIVTDKAGEALLGVNVYLKGTYTGATTGIDGTFSFQSMEVDSLVLIATYIGFHTIEVPLAPKDQFLRLVLKEKVSQLNAVVITAGSFNASDEQKREVLKPLDIVTTAGATADIPGALNTLPGTQTVGETGRLFVRGGEGRETKTFIDGMLVHNEYSPSAPNTPGRSRFSPFMFKGMSFSTGGYSAEYGQALSSALILQSKDISENDRVDVSVMSVGVDASVTKAFKNSSLAGKVQYTNLTPYFELAPQNLKWEHAPEEVNGNFAYRLKTSQTGMLKVFTNLSSSVMDLYESDIAHPEVVLPVRVTNDYGHVNINYRELLNDQWGLRSGASFTKSKDAASLGSGARQQELAGYHVKLVADYQHSDRLAVVGGSEVISREVSQELNDTGESLLQEFNETISAAFIESQVFLSSSLAFKGGTRVEHHSLSQRLSVAPRFSAAYKTGDHSQVSVAYGQFYQSPAMQVVLTSPESTAENATHWISNYQWMKEGRSFRIELYQKQYRDLVKYTNVFDPTSFGFDGKGHAKGLDLFWRDTKSFKNLDYWVSYSLLDTERDYQDFPGAFTPAFASTHNFSFVMKKFVDAVRSQIGLTYSYSSGRRFNDLNSSEFLGGKTPDYHDLSFNISYLYSNQVIVHAMVNNVLGVNNIFGYEFASEHDENGFYASRPIAPPAKRFLFLGVFITLSKNKGINQLPNL